MGLWDDEAFREKHEDEWRRDKYGYYDDDAPEDYVHDEIEGSLKNLLDVFNTVGLDFYECCFGDYVDYLVDMYNDLTRSEYPIFETTPANLSEVECANLVLDALTAFLPDVQANIDDAPEFTDEYNLYDIVYQTEEGIKWMQKVINDGGIV